MHDTKPVLWLLAPDTLVTQRVWCEEKAAGEQVYAGLTDGEGP